MLLTRALRVTGLHAGLSGGLARWQAPRAVNDPGETIADLAVTLALGGGCLADIAMLRVKPALFGPVASDPVVSRLISRLAADAPRALKAIRPARPPPGNGPGRSRGCCTRRGRPADPGRHRRDDRDLLLGQRPGHADVEEDFRVPSLTVSLIMALAGLVSRWPSRCGPVMPGPARPPITSRPPAWRWPSSPPTCGGRCWSALTPAAAPKDSGLAGQARSAAAGPGRVHQHGEIRTPFLAVPAKARTPAYDGDGKTRDGAWIAESPAC